MSLKLRKEGNTISAIKRLRHRLKKQINLISDHSLGIVNRLVLTRSLLEGDAVLNFWLERDTRSRIELFACYDEFEWGSHQIVKCLHGNRTQSFMSFLLRVKKRYPMGFSKYYRLIRRRLGKDLLQHRQKAALKIVNSDKHQTYPVKFRMVATYMAHHNVTKLPFPYRVEFGKSITYFVLNYTGVNRGTYWLLADLTHGTLLPDVLDIQTLNVLISQIIKMVKNDLAN